MQCSVCNVQCSVCNVQCSVCNVLSMQCLLCTVQCLLCAVQCLLCAECRCSVLFKHSFPLILKAGMQQVSKTGRPHLKMLSYVKHYTAYNVETDRFEFKAPVSNFTMWDSFLPQYQMAFKEVQN